ncbi:hypothetical protein NDU88_000326 [Pleurodeles waltl]|uniref:Uncharacterized protein n=1 Tax=Pleurodeles waltl TaxID=8319 RepID=A0AAV7WJ73_PLEWA|nr:hypothetical protein NDU88_000326 [Pleurodeles waltl]
MQEGNARRGYSKTETRDDQRLPEKEVMEAIAGSGSQHKEQCRKGTPEEVTARQRQEMTSGCQRRKLWKPLLGVGVNIRNNTGRERQKRLQQDRDKRRPAAAREGSSRKPLLGVGVNTRNNAGRERQKRLQQDRDKRRPAAAREGSYGSHCWEWESTQGTIQEGNARRGDSKTETRDDQRLPEKEVMEAIAGSGSQHKEQCRKGTPEEVTARQRQETTSDCQRRKLWKPLLGVGVNTRNNTGRERQKRLQQDRDKRRPAAAREGSYGSHCWEWEST